MNRLVRKSASGRTLLSYAYDLNGNLTHQKDVTGKITEYRYNSIDLLENVTDNGNMVVEYLYHPDGTIKGLFKGALYAEYKYDADRNLTGLKTTLDRELLVDNHYHFDKNGNQIVKQQIGGTTRYTYDVLNQLTKVEYPSYTEELYYDKAGNRSRRVIGGTEELYRYDPRNRLTEYTKGGMSNTFTYDNAGNLLTDDRARYTYDVFNRTEKVETFDGHIQINRYDAEGLRQELEEDGKLVQFIFRGGEVVAEKTEDNIIRLVRGYDLVASDAENARTYYHYASDELGSITHVVDDHEVLNRYEYDVWGNLAVCEERVPNRFLFTGQQYDPVTQQYYLRARFYNPVIARFTQEDTYRGDGLNLYAYCRNNPVCYVDPSGHWCDNKEQIYQRLAAEQPADSNVSQLELMARAANIAKGKESGPGETIILRDLSESGRGTQGIGNPVKVEGRGSTGRTTPNTLKEQMAMHQVQSSPLDGAIDMSQLKRPVIMNDPRWPASEGWIKMSNNVNGIEIHFVHNKNTGAFDDFKFK